MRWLREPLLHFFVAGVLVFAAYELLREPDGAEAPAHRVELTLDDLRQLEITFAARWQRRPTPDEMARLIEARVQEEILYREALALGLDEEDAIVRRRLAQKMEFLAEDLSEMNEPTDADLKAWFERNRDRFAMPGRVTLRHLYFSPDVRGAGARYAAAAALAKLAAASGTSPDAEAIGDEFMFQDHLTDRSPEQLAKAFGPNFSREVFGLEPGSWQGPIESGYGWHLVFVSEAVRGRLPRFEEVEPEVESAWLAERRSEARRRAYEEMRAKYELVLPVPGESGMAPKGPTSPPSDAR